VTDFRKKNNETPVVLMGYANPVEVMGYEAFAKAASEAGIDGVLTVDLPPEEAHGLKAELKKYDIDNIFLIAPTTTEQRIKDIAALASGYLYYVSLKGVTGAGNLDVDSVKEKVALIQSITELPICVGFGIKDADSCRKISQLADGAVVGSALVDKIATSDSLEQALELAGPFIQSLRQAMDN
jgi:tryptophan synthase alpha chain